MILLLVAAAYAGEPFVGTAPQFGSARVVRHAPIPTCARIRAPGIRWACPDEIAGLPMTTYFMVEHRRWTGVMTVGEVSVFEVPYVLGALETTWGAGTLAPNGGFMWRAGDYIGTLNADKPTGEPDPWEADDRQVEVRVVLASSTELQRVDP